MTLTAAEIWRKYEIAGVPASGAHRPVKSEIITWATLLETLSNVGAGLAYANRSALNADLAHPANTFAIVYADGTAAYNGMYVKVGGSGVGSWTRAGDLPTSLVRVTVTGGTGDAIVATAPETPTLPGSKLFLMTPTADNTGTTTIAINGTPAVAIKTALGSALVDGSLIAGSQVLMAWAVDHYQLLISVPVDAEGVLNDVLDARDAAEGFKDGAEAAASALGNQVHQYDTRALAAAATIPVGVKAIKVTRYATGYPLSYATYIPSTSSPPDGAMAFADAGGQYWELDLSGETASASWFGAVGSGAVNDRAALQAGIDALTARGGGRLVLAPNKTYRVDLDLSVPNYGLIMKPGVTLDVNGAAVNLVCNHEGVYGIRLQSNSHIVGPGTVATTVATMTVGQSVFNSPISVGACYGEVLDVDAVGPFINASNWSVRNLTLTSVRAGNGSVFQGIGGVNHGLLENLTFPDNNTISIAIGFDHGMVGLLSAADIPGSRAAFEAGDAYSVFPHDVVIRRCKIGKFLKPLDGADGGMGIRLSGCYKFTIEDIEVDATTFAGFFHTAGDFGFEFAPASPYHVERLSYRGTTIKNYHVYDAHESYGFYCECLADNIQVAVGSGYSPRISPIYNTDILFEGCRTWTTVTTLAANAKEGFYIHSQIGGTLRNCFARYHLNGVRVLGGCDELLIDGGEFIYSYGDNIYVGDTTAPKDISIVGVKCYAGGQDPGGSVYAGIRFGTATRPRAERCVLGYAAESAQDTGITVTSSCTGAILIGNNVLGTSGGAAYVLAGSTNYTSINLFRENMSASGISAAVSGINIIPVDYLYSLGGRSRRFLTSRSVMTVTPGAGDWLLGDTIDFYDPVSTGYAGCKCVSAGSPGTWKNYGVLT